MRRIFMAEDNPADVYMLDLNLPQHDGTDILRFVRQSPELRSIPTVLFTSSDSPKDRLNAIREGADRFIRKPSQLREYMAIGTTLKNIMESEVETQRSAQ